MCVKRCGIAIEYIHKQCGIKLNIPLQPNCTDDVALKLWQIAEQFLEKAQPEFIILQCGADSLAGDPITQLQLSSAFHGEVTKQLVVLADKHSKGRLLALGGGGYNLKNIKAAGIMCLRSCCSYPQRIQNM